MRSLNFRDYVLHPIAYKMGLDPTINFENSQAFAIGTYINGYVRRSWTAADWPEWSRVTAFTPLDHIVPYVLITPEETFEIGKVLRVFLVDPRTTDFPTDTPFVELEQGVHVGYEHGTQVWIKYLPFCPVFTAVPWDSNRSYFRNDVTYSITTGECYKSKVDFNLNHDPAIVDTHSLTLELIQESVPGTPGFDAVNKIMSVSLVRVDDVPLIDPPPSGATFEIEVKDSTGAVIATANEIANGTDDLATILASLQTTISADPDLATFTITIDVDTLTITFEDASDFLSRGRVTPATTAQFELKNTQSQSYIPATAPAERTTQQVKLTITDQDMQPGATFTFAFFDTLGVMHEVSYVAKTSDSTAQVLQGLASAMQTANDSTLNGLITLVDPATGSMLITSPYPGGIKSEMSPAGNAWWSLVPFPFDLIDTVIRGANADVLKEWGQDDKAMSEEQAVPQEIGIRTTVAQNQNFESLSARDRNKSRYVIR